MAAPRTLSRVSGMLAHSSHLQRSRSLVPAAFSCRTTKLRPRLGRTRPGLGAHNKMLSTSAAHPKGIMPDTDNPARKPAPSHVTASTLELSDSEYHHLADEYLEKLVSKLEEVQDERADVEVEYASGVLNLTFGDKGKYVVNKQPPNKQIWVSSPVSGPARYDWVVYGDSQGDKEGTAIGGWVNSRTGTPLDNLFFEELGVDLSVPAFG